MPDVGLRVILEAQAQQASQSINNLSQEFINLGATANRSAANITTSLDTVNRAGTAITRLSPITAAAAAGITNLTRAVGTGVAAFVRNERSVTGLVGAGSDVIIVTNGITAALNRLSPVSSTAAAGITNLSQAVGAGNASFVTGDAANDAYLNSLNSLNTTIAQTTGITNNLAPANAATTASIAQLTRSVGAEQGALNRLNPVAGAAALGITNLSRAVDRGQATLVGFSRTTQQATIAAQNLSTANNSINVTTVSVTRSLNGLAPVERNIISQFAQLRDAVAAGGTSLNQFSVTANGVTRNLLNSTVPGANRAATVFQNLGRVASDAPFGFIAIQNNLDPLLDSFRRLQAETGSVGGALRALGTSLAGSAGVALGFSLISSTVTVLIQKYGSLSAALSALNPFISRAERAQILLNKALLDGAVKGQEEVAHLRLMYAATQDLNVPLQERKIITDNLIKQYPDTFKGLGQEKILAGEAAAAYELLNNQLTASAAIKASEGLVAKQLGGLIKLKVEANKLQAALKELQDPAGGRGFFSKDGLQIDRDIAVQQNRINSNLADQKALEAEIAAIQKVQLDTVKQYGAAVLGVNSIAPKKEKKKKEKKTDEQKIAEIFKNIGQDFTVLDTVFAATGGNVQKLAEDKIPILTSALAELSKLGALPGTELFDQIDSQIKNLQYLLGQNNKAITIPIAISPIAPTSNAATIKTLTDNLKNQFKPQIDSFTKDINALIKESTRNGISSLAEGIGDALGKGGGIQNVLQSFVGIIADFGSKLGKQLIVQGVAIEAFKTSLASLQGIGAIAAGAALIAASAGFKALASKGINSYATGGIVTQPQLALIGDNPGRKEAVIPSEMFDKLGGTNNMELTTRISGGDLLVVVRRADREFKRFN